MKKIKTVSIVIFLVSLMVLPLAGVAQSTSDVKEYNANASDKLGAKKPLEKADEYQGNASATLGEKKKALQDARGDIKQIRLETLEEIKQKREAFREENQKKIEEMKRRVEEAKDQRKAKLEAIKDAKKKVIIERVDNKLTEINKNRAEHFENMIEKIVAVLDRIKERAVKMEGKRRDITTVKAAITEAEQAIADAKTAITAQAGKAYVTTITTENALKAKANEVKKTLENDLIKVREAVKKAQQAVQKTAVALAQAARSNQTATTTPSTTGDNTSTSTAATTTNTTTNNQ